MFKIIGRITFRITSYIFIIIFWKIKYLHRILF
nr:MAG TPA: hypothetical protein [Caudoviricetes sp.]